MDDLNRKRLEKGQALSWHGKDEDEINDMLVEAVKAHGFNGRTYSGPQNNPVGDYWQSTWQPLGEFPTYEVPKLVAKLIGYTLVTTQREEEWFYLYFDAEADRGGCMRRVDLCGDEVVGICRSDLFEGGLVDPLSKFTKAKGQRLVAVEAFRSGRLAMRFESHEIEVEWDSPLDAGSEPEGGPVVYEEATANFERVLIAEAR